MRFPIRLSTFIITVAWLTCGAVALLHKDYLTALAAFGSIAYAFEVALYLRDQDYQRRRLHQNRTRTDKKDPHL